MAIQSARAAVGQEDGSGRVFGAGLTCVMVVSGDVVVVTLFV
jgi:hypothetical protein